MFCFKFRVLSRGGGGAFFWFRTTHDAHLTIFTGQKYAQDSVLNIFLIVFDDIKMSSRTKADYELYSASPTHRIITSFFFFPLSPAIHTRWIYTIVPAVHEWDLSRNSSKPRRRSLRRNCFTTQPRPIEYANNRRKSLQTRVKIRLYYICKIHTHTRFKVHLCVCE